MALSLLLAERRASVSVVEGLIAVRDKLEVRIIIINRPQIVQGLTDGTKDVRKSQDQRFVVYHYDLTLAEAGDDPLEVVIPEGHGRRMPPDATFLCAGGATPKLLVEMTKEEFVLEMAYWVQVWTACVGLSQAYRNLLHLTTLEAVSQAIVRDRKKGKICFVSSVLGCIMSFIGHASYCPGKHARVRGLADD